MAESPSKDNKRQPWSREVRASARDIYITGATIPEISKEIGVPVPTLRYWQGKDNWADSKRNLELASNEATLDNISNALTRSRSDALRDFILIQEVAKDGIEDEDLKFRDKKQAVDSLSMGLKGERELLDQKVSVSLIVEVAKLLDDELTDPFLRQRLGSKLAAIGRLYAFD